MDCVLNFIALGAIAQIDSIYSQSLQKFPLKKALEEPLDIKRTSKDIPFKSRKFLSKCIRIIYKLYRVLYVTGYYYFTPYATPVITYLIVGFKNKYQVQGV